MMMCQEDASPFVPRQPFCIRVLTSVEQMVALNEYEQEALEPLKHQSYVLAKTFDHVLLIKTEIGHNNDRAFGYASWDAFSNITESGSQFLTMEFLMSLVVEESIHETKICFPIFNEEFVRTAKGFSVALDFNKKFFIEPNRMAKEHRYDRST